MKKSLFLMAAAAAMMLTACTSENDILESGPAKQAVPQEVGFDVYTPAATSVTRAGLEGTMTTSRLQRSENNGGGFGVYAYLVEDDDDALATAKAYNSSDPGAPNFMINEKLLWNTVNLGWYYSPLKYWPNETNNDSQTSPATMENNTTQHLDRLTFFAYAPYVSAGNRYVPGIRHMTAKDGLLWENNDATGNKYSTSVTEASINYRAALTDPNQAVDLLWGVAPTGGLTYTAVNGTTVNIAEGMPLVDMIKPNVNTSMKFLFQHALARFNVTAVAAIDQVGAGGKLDPNTKININEITITGPFGEYGDLNLDNKHANVANWVKINSQSITSSTTAISTPSTITLSTANGAIAQHLRFTGDHGTPAKQTAGVGVTTTRQSVIEPSAPNTTTQFWSSSKKYAANELAYSETTPYYTDEACTSQATVTMPASYTIDNNGIYTEVAENTTFKYPTVLQNYKQATGFTLVTTENAASFVGYQAYSNYKPKDGALAANDYIYAGSTYYKVPADEVAYYTSLDYKPFTKLGANEYIPVSGNPHAEDYVVADGLYLYEVNANVAGSFDGQQAYTKKTDAGVTTYTPKAVGTTPANGDYVVCGKKELFVPYYAANTYYKRDANYFMVIPTNNVKTLNSGLTADQEKALRTVTVKIEYYITTEDSKLAAGRAQTKNVVTKEVLLPSLDNGKSYNLNLVLGLTSVKIEAEVDDWKVVNSQVDLPQNTDGD